MRLQPGTKSASTPRSIRPLHRRRLPVRNPIGTTTANARAICLRFVPPLSIDALDGGCPVTIVTVAVAEFCPVSVTDVGFTEQVEFCGVPVHASVTVPVEPFNGRIESMKVAVCPSVMVAVFDPLTVIEKSSPPPERAITAESSAQ